jgi:hypothetical protein
MNCHRRECAVSMREVDAFPRLCSSAPALTAALIALMVLVFAAAAFASA